jgi:hypothetical protein
MDLTNLRVLFEDSIFLRMFIFIFHIFKLPPFHCQLRFTTPQAASLALKLNGQRLDGRPLTVRSFATLPNTPRGGMGNPWGLEEFQNYQG